MLRTTFVAALHFSLAGCVQGRCNCDNTGLFLDFPCSEAADGLSLDLGGACAGARVEPETESTGYSLRLFPSQDGTCHLVVALGDGSQVEVDRAIAESQTCCLGFFAPVDTRHVSVGSAASCPAADGGH
jgi:hypothetical protein